VDCQHAEADTRAIMCADVLREIKKRLPLLGIIQRSSEEKGPVEFYGPFFRLVQAFVPDAAVIIAADWDFLPYTFFNPDISLPSNFVIVLIPFHESDNGLISPLASHELGHSLWRIFGIDEKLANEVDSEVNRLAGDQFKELIKSRQLSRQNDTLFESRLEDKAHIWAMKQTEELFCDCLAISIFGESFLWAFEYLMAPWNMPRSIPRYPTLENRLFAHRVFAKSAGVPLPPGYEEKFGPTQADSDDPAVQMADLAARASIPVIFQITSDLLREIRGTLKNNNVLEFYASPWNSNINEELISLDAREVEILRIVTCFEDGYPPTGVTSMIPLFVAAWRRRATLFEIDQIDDGGGELTEKLVSLNEILLKALEILEIEYQLEVRDA